MNCQWNTFKLQDFFFKYILSTRIAVSYIVAAVLVSQYIWGAGPVFKYMTTTRIGLDIYFVSNVPDC